MINTRTVAEIAVEMPHARRVFEQFGIDYCCGGGESLVAACTATGSDIVEVVAAITNAGTGAGSEVRYADLDQRKLVKHIIDTHHVFTRKEINRITLLLEKVVSVHGSRHPELASVQKNFSNLAEDLIPHMLKEENVLFPYIVELEAARLSHSMCPRPRFVTVQNPVRMMLFEHDLAGQLLRQLRSVTSDYAVPADACISYKTLYESLQNFEKDLHLHIHLENNILFPRAIEMETVARRPERTAS